MHYQKRILRISSIWQESKRGQDEYLKNLNATPYTEGGTLHLKSSEDPFKIFIPIVYNKGAWVVHMLRHVMGDGSFYEAMKAYCQERHFRYKYVTTDDLQGICEKWLSSTTTNNICIHTINKHSNYLGINNQI